MTTNVLIEENGRIRCYAHTVATQDGQMLSDELENSMTKEGNYENEKKVTFR